MGSRGISGRSTPPRGANICLIAVPSPTSFLGFGSLSAFFNISLASSSMERPCVAARKRNRLFVVSSTFRMRMLAMISMISHGLFATHTLSC